MKAYVSLHTQRPSCQLDAEVKYKGYHRLEVEFNEDELGKKSIQCRFPIIEGSSEDVVKYVAIGACEKGQGEVFMTVPILPHIHLVDTPERRTREFWRSHGIMEKDIDACIANHGFTQPQVGIANTSPVTYPPHLNPIARMAHQLVTRGLMETSELHPKLFEAINDALQNAGVPILHVKRSSAAHMKIDLKSLNLGDFGNA